MEAADFNELFDAEVADPIVAIGGTQRGRSVFWHSDGLTAALLRTELRFNPPPKLTLCIRHSAMRDMEEKVPASPSSNPSDYPIKLLPTSAAELFEPAFSYTPYNLGRYPQETFDYRFEPEGRIRQRLTDLGVFLGSALPELDRVLTPAWFLQRLVDDGENAWCERMWVDDMRGEASGWSNR